MPAITIIRADGQAFVFDGVQSYTLTSSVSVTEHPVERGAPAADHAQVQPKLLSLARAIVTETPYSNVDTVGGPDRVSRALEFLDSIAGTYVTVVTERFGTLENMAILRYPTTADVVRRLGFDIDFKQVRLVEAGFVDIAPGTPVQTDSTGGETSAASGLPTKQDAGEQATTPTEEGEQEEADTSLLLDLLTAVGAEP